MKTKQLIWDMPTRVFHWSFALSFAGAYLTSESEHYRNIHVALGYIMGGLIVFRLIWGFVGSHYAQFKSFQFNPSAALNYVREVLNRTPSHHIGHNPAGAIAIYLLILSATAIVGSGLMLYWEWGDEDIFEEIHEIVANGMLLLVVIHIAGVVVSSLLHQENLPRAMVTGYKTVSETVEPVKAYVAVGIALFSAVMGFAIWYLS